MNGNHQITYTEEQQTVIQAEGGYHIVLAPPGCGKTQLLTERIRQAHSKGVEYGDMLCLTFTNRAARGMQERISQYINEQDTTELFVGNLHRYCAHFLYAYDILPAETSIIDENDSLSILARYIGDDEYNVIANPRRRREYADIFHLETFIHQIRNHYPKALRTHPECLNKDDIAAIKAICRVTKKEFTPELMADIFDHADTYRSLITSDTTDYGDQNIIRTMLRKMELACHYARYKHDNHLVDFEDLLVKTYDTLQQPPTEYKGFHWIQIDEVQDLNPLQIAIIDLLTNKDAPFTVIYLGDEQQAIFSFMGAKLDTLQMLRQRCGDNIYTLQKNHRSPDYLQAVFHTYQEKILGTPSLQQPTPNNQQPIANSQQLTANSQQLTANNLRILQSENSDSEVADVADLTKEFFYNYPEETTAILVSANNDADIISQALTERQLSHFKVSGDDIFASPAMKLMLAHLNVLNNEHNFMAWAHILSGLRVCQSPAYARNFVRAAMNVALLPSDLIQYTNTTYIQEFTRYIEERDIVIFDTETTGLNVFEDDIVQIAAVKLHKGEVVEDSAFTIFLDTDKPIPPRLGDIENPLIEALRHNIQVTPREALRRFLDYVGDATLFAHNANFDIHILQENIRRHFGDQQAVAYGWAGSIPPYFDTLKAARLLHPGLTSFKLKNLLATLHLEGANTHLADDDVQATVSLLLHLHKRAQAIIPEQREFLQRERVQQCADMLRSHYAAAYFRAQAALYRRDALQPVPALVSEMTAFYRRLIDDGMLKPLQHINRVWQFLTDDIIDSQREPSLVEQLSRHIMEINTFKEADLCNSTALTDRIFVTTVHKAKGLEFDNVIIFEATDNRYPGFYSRQNPRLLAEDARKFYVALTRAKRRIIIAASRNYFDRYNQPRPHDLTPFMTPILHFFSY